MSNTPIKHHYVQKAYLKRFSYDRKHVFALRKEEDIIFTPNITDICSENNFNTRYDDRNNRDMGVEIGLSEIENSYPNQLFRIIPGNLKYPYQNGGIILDGIEKNILIETILLQLVRSKTTREFGRSIIDAVYREKLNEARNKFSSSKNYRKRFCALKRNEEIIKRNALVESPLLFYAKDHSNNLIRDNLRHRSCIIFINHSSEEFITSDNPVLISDMRGCVRRIDDYPLIKPDSVVVYPLDPYRMAALLSPKYFNDSECKAGIISIYSEDDLDTIRCLNKAQYQCGSSYVLANSKEALDNLRLT